MDKIRILTVGAGAVGAYFTGRLAQKGAEVSVVARSDYNEVRQNGYDIKSIAGDFVFKPAGVYRDAAAYPGTPDYVFLCSKVLPEINQAALIKGAVKSPKTVIVLIQNGIGIEDSVAEAFPQNEILSCTAYIGVTRIAHGVIQHKGSGRIKMGRFGGGVSESAEKIAALFTEAGVDIELVDDIELYRWVKLLWNLPFNSISVLGGGLLTNEMTDRGPIEELCRCLMHEVILVAKACGKDIPESLIDENIEFTRTFPPYKTSMLIDFESGRRLEVEAIVGNVYRLALKHKVDVPKIQACYALLSAVGKQKK